MGLRISTRDRWSVGLSIGLSVRLTVRPSDQPLIHFPVRPSVRSSVRPSVRPVLFSSNFFLDFCRFPAHFRRFSGISFKPNLQFSDRCIISFFPDHFKWLTGTVPQFVAVLQERNLDFLSKKKWWSTWLRGRRAWCWADNPKNVQTTSPLGWDIFYKKGTIS